MEDKAYKPPKIPKSAEAKERIYAGIAKNELLGQCALRHRCCLGLHRVEAVARVWGGAAEYTPVRACVAASPTPRRRSL